MSLVPVSLLRPVRLDKATRVMPLFRGDLPHYYGGQDSPLPPPRSGIGKWLVGAVLLMGGFLGVRHLGAPLRDPIQMHGAYFNPRHPERPDLMVTRTYGLKTPGHRVSVELFLDIEPQPPNRNIFERDFNAPWEFEAAARQPMRWFHFQAVKPKIQSFLLYLERTHGPAGVADRFAEALRQPWTDESGKEQPPLKGRALGTMTLQGQPYTVKVMKGSAFSRF